MFNTTDLEFLPSHRVPKDYFQKLLGSVAWQAHKRTTGCNYYATESVLTTLITQRRLDSLCRWTDVVHIFRTQPPHLREIFREGQYRFCRSRQHIWPELIHSGSVSERGVHYGNKVLQNCFVLRHCIGFIDGNVIGTTHSQCSAEHNVAYIGHRRENAIKFHTITSPDGLQLHAD